MARELSERRSRASNQRRVGHRGLHDTPWRTLFSIGRIVVVGCLNQNGPLGLEAFDCHHQ